MPTATLTIAIDDSTLQGLGQSEMVLVPLAAYNALLDKLEDLQDLADMAEAEAAYRAGEGRDFEEFVAELEAA